METNDLNVTEATAEVAETAAPKGRGAFFRVTLPAFLARPKVPPAATCEDPPLYEIRPFDGRDYRPLAVLHAAFRQQQGLSVLTAAQWHALRSEAEQGNLVFYIACAQGKSVGFCALHCSWDADHNAVTGCLDAVFVLPEMRRRGIGQALLNRAAEFSRENGALQMSIAANTQQSGFCASCGFQSDDRQVSTLML